MCLQHKSFENTMGKGDIACNEQCLLSINMALVNGGYLHYTDKEIHLNSSLKGTRKKIGYGPVINSAERSRALLALLF